MLTRETITPPPAPPPRSARRPTRARSRSKWPPGHLVQLGPTGARSTRPRLSETGYDVVVDAVHDLRPRRRVDRREGPSGPRGPGRRRRGALASRRRRGPSRIASSQVAHRGEGDHPGEVDVEGAQPEREVAPGRVTGDHHRSRGDPQPAEQLREAAYGEVDVVPRDRPATSAPDASVLRRRRPPSPRSASARAIGRVCRRSHSCFQKPPWRSTTSGASGPGRARAPGEVQVDDGVLVSGVPHRGVGQGTCHDAHPTSRLVLPA